MSKKKEDLSNRQKELDSMLENPLALTTIDNPFNPHTQFEEWNAFDIKKGYNSCAYLARIVKSSSELSEADEILAINEAIREILELNITGKYIAVTKKNFKSRMRSIKSIGLLK